MVTTPSQLASRTIMRFVELTNIFSCALFLIFAGIASAQTIELKAKQTFADDGMLTVRGSVKCQDLYPQGQREVVNEITVSLEWIAADGRFRQLPATQRIEPFALLKDGKVIADEEINGIRAERVELWTYTPSPKDEGKKISFEGVGRIENGAQYRLVGELKHSWRGTWPAVIYRQSVIGPQPVPGAQPGEMPQVIPAPETWTVKQLEATTARIADWIRNATLERKAPAPTPAGDIPDALVDENFEEYMTRLAKAFEEKHVKIARQRTVEMSGALRTALGDVYSENLSVVHMRSAYGTRLSTPELQYAARMQTFAAVMKSYHDTQTALMPAGNNSE